MATFQRRSLAAILVSAALLTGGDAFASEAATLRTSFVGQRWSVEQGGGDDLQQLYAAAQLDLPRVGGLPVNLYGYFPFAWTEDGAADAKLSGAGDAQLRATWRPDVSLWAVTLGVDLPTGKTPLSAEEYVVATRILASRVLDFTFKRPGEGLDLMLSVARSLPLGSNTALAVAAAGYLKGEYDVIEDAAGALIRTAPGDRVHLSASLRARETARDPVWDWRVDLGLQLAADAQLRRTGGETTISEGTQGTLELSYGHRLFRTDRLRLFTYLLGRGENRVAGRDQPAVEILGIGTRWVAEFGAIYTRPLGTSSDLDFGLAHTIYQIEPAADINSRITSLTLGLERRFAARASLAAKLRWGMGSTPWTLPDQTETWERRDLTGWSLGLSSRITW